MIKQENRAYYQRFKVLCKSLVKSYLDKHR